VLPMSDSPTAGLVKVLDECHAVDVWDN